MANYARTSPWSATSMTRDYLGILNIRTIPAEDDDPIYQIEPQYIYRPDLLSFDIYGTPKLWWVFMQRNMNKIQDPVFDFVPGLIIYLPKKDPLLKALGL